MGLLCLQRRQGRGRRRAPGQAGLFHPAHRPLQLPDVGHADRRKCSRSLSIFCRSSKKAAAQDEEQFGPVLPVIPYDSEAEALDKANDTVFGLGGSVWGEEEHAAKVAAQIECAQLAPPFSTCDGRLANRPRCLYPAPAPSG